MPKTRLIFGCGYIGLPTARAWRDRRDRVIAITRSATTAARLRDEQIEPMVADVTDPASLGELPAADTVLYAIGYDRRAEPSIYDVYAGGVERVLNSLPAATGRFVYVSTTGVYGDAGGDWVDEQTQPDPQRDGGKASLAAERALAASGRDGVALRLAGIYGPARLPYVDALRAGEPIRAPREGWLNLIQRHDAVAAVLAAAEAADPPPLVCVSDGAPPKRANYYAEMARLLDAAPPQYAEPQPGSPRAARAAADKRVANRLLVEQLGVRLRYPSYREGLAASLPGERG